MKSKEKKSEDSSRVDMASVLRKLLKPVLAVSDEKNSVDDIYAALATARAGMRMCQHQPDWLASLYDACGQWLRQLKPLMRTQSVEQMLLGAELPAQMRAGAEQIEVIAAKQSRRASHVLMSWQLYGEGRACLGTVHRALKQGRAAKSVALSDGQIDDCLCGRAARVDKCRQQLLHCSDWRRIKKLGQAAQKLAWARRYVVLLGLPLSSSEFDADIQRYRAVACQRRAATWLKRQSERQKFDADSCIACGALWIKACSERQRIEVDLLASAAVLTSDASEAERRKRPEFPLRMQFGSVAMGAETEATSPCAEPV